MAFRNSRIRPGIMADNPRYLPRWLDHRQRVERGRKGGQARVPNGFARMPVEQARRIRSLGGKARHAK